MVLAARRPALPLKGKLSAGPRFNISLSRTISKLRVLAATSDGRDTPPKVPARSLRHLPDKTIRLLLAVELFYSNLLTARPAYGGDYEALRAFPSQLPIGGRQPALDAEGSIAIFVSRLPFTPILLLLVGVFCCATSVLMIKASQLHPALLSAYRLLLSAALLSPLYAHNLRKYRGEYFGRDLRLTFLPAAMLAFHFITWTQGAQWTHAANATLIVCMVPVVMPFLLFFTIGEKITKAEIIGTLMALGGAVWLTASDFWVSRQTLLGDITCFVSMLLFSFYLAQARTNRNFPNIWLYLVPLYAVAGAICFFVALFFAHPLALPPAREYLIVIGLVVIPTILGHSILNHAMRHLRGQTVSVVNLFQFLFAGALAYFLYGEVPRPVFYAAGALVVGGAIVVIHAMASTAEGEREAEAASTPEV